MKLFDFSTTNYININLSNINSYGDHLGLLKGLQGRACSILNWSSVHDARNLTEYLIEKAKADPEELFFSHIGKDPELVAALNSIRNLPVFTEISSRDAALLVVAFKDQIDNLQTIFNNYKYLREDTSLNCNIHSFIPAVQKTLAIDELKMALKITTSSEEAINLLKLCIPKGLIFNTSLSTSNYLYTLIPILDTTFKYLTFDLLYENFGAFFVSSMFADLSVTFLSSFILGAYNYSDQGYLAGAMKGLKEEWDKKVADDNSFHPLVEALMSGIFMAFNYLTVDKFEKTILTDSFLYILSQYGIKNFSFKYAALNAYFTLKAQIAQNDIKLLSLSKSTLGGLVRGTCKNHLMDYLVSPWKLSIATGLQNYSTLLSETYLKEWWIKDILANTTVASTPLWLLIDNPARLLSALYLTREILDILANGFAKAFEIVSTPILWFFLQKSYEYKTTIILLLALKYVNPNAIIQNAI